MHFAQNVRSFAVAAALMTAALWPGMATAQQQEPLEDVVLARVNGDDITGSDLDQVTQELNAQLSRIPADQRYSMMLNVMIDVRLMARAAEADGLADEPGMKRRLKNIRDNQLRAEYLRVNASDPVTAEVIEKRFQEEIADFVPAPEVRARHILVTDEAEAIAIIEQLDNGAEFAAIAQEKSIDPGSGRNGGDLGFFAEGAMVKAFSDAAFTLEVGTYTSEPIQSQFGYHIIMVEENRMQAPPTLAQRSEEIRRKLVSDALVAVSDALRGSADIQVIGPDGELIPLQTTEN